jgi:hypothetical protein
MGDHEERMARLLPGPAGDGGLDVGESCRLFTIMVFGL